MEFEKCLEIFENYVKKYDISIEEIKYKYEHTYRVVEYAKIICEKEKFSSYDKNISLVCALFHDIARFEEWTKYGSWNKIDHGDLGYEILKENNLIDLITDDEKEQEIILNVVKYHNKFSLPDSLNEMEMKVLSVVRDADKIDILNTQTNDKHFEKNNNIYWDEQEKTDLSKTIINNILNEELVDNKLVTNTGILLVKQLTFLFDINYRTSFKIIYNLDIVNKKLNVLKNLIIDDKKYKLIEMKFKDYLESNIML